MATIQESLEDVLDLDGAVGAALVDVDSGVTIKARGGGSLDMELAGAGSISIILSTVESLDENEIDDSIEDVLITLDSQYHLIRRNAEAGSVFFYVVMDREQSNLAFVRRHLAEIDANLDLEGGPLEYDGGENDGLE